MAGASIEVTLTAGSTRHKEIGWPDSLVYQGHVDALPHLKEHASHAGLFRNKSF